MLLVPLFYSQERRNDFWSGPAVISVCNFLYNFIKSPKKWSGQNRTSQTGSYTYESGGNSLVTSFPIDSNVYNDHLPGRGALNKTIKLCSTKMTLLLQLHIFRLILHVYSNKLRVITV